MTHLLSLVVLMSLDGGAGLDGGLRLRPEDAEVVRDLELLENLDPARDFDLLEELSVER
jgi:hypothetical protein